MDDLCQALLSPSIISPHLIMFCISGRELEGIHFAMSFLERWQRKQHKSKKILPTALTPGESMLSTQEKATSDLPTLAAGKRVVVIGGGDTGVDCIATAARMVSTPSYLEAVFIDNLLTCWGRYDHLRSRNMSILCYITMVSIDT